MRVYPRLVESREERKVVSAVYVDLVGSTPLAENLDPEDVRAILRRYFGVVRLELERLGGVVEKFIGDAIVAVFGAPRAREDDPERAVRAAIAARDAIAREARDDPAFAIEVRLAVATDNAVVSLDARPEAGEGMVVGDLVNRACRLQQGAPPGSVVVDERTYRATSETIEYESVGSIVAKGKANPVAAWKALTAHPPGSGPRRALSATPFVGRERELSLLDDAFARARAEREAQLVTLVGVPGIGKTRLMVEFLRSTERLDEHVISLHGRCLPYGGGVAMWALAEMVKACAGILDTDPAEIAAQKLADTIGALRGPQHEWVEPYLRPLIGLQAEHAQPERAGAAFGALRSFFEALAEERPLVLVFEDLQWADDVLLDFIDHVAEWTRDVPILVLCTTRPELLLRRPDWGGGKLNALTLALGALTDTDAARLVASLLAGNRLDVATQAALLARAGGNPLFTEQFVRMLGDDATIEVPDSVQAIIAARLDLLEPDEKALVQDAAVVGEIFWPGALASVGGRAPQAVADALHVLQRKEFVRSRRSSSVGGETEYAFRHILVRDVCYGQIPRRARAEKHRAVGAWIEQLSDRTDDFAELLAHHYTTALEIVHATGGTEPELAARARVALRDAGDRARRLHSFAAAESHYAAALELWPEEDGERPLLAFHTLLVRAERSEAPELEQDFEDVRDALIRVGDLEHAAEAEVKIATFRRFAGERERATAILFRALERLERLPDSSAKAEVLYAITLNYGLANKSDLCIEFGRRTLAIADAIGYRDLSAGVKSLVGYARLDTGDLGGLEDLELSIAERERLNSHEVALSYVNAGSAIAELIGDVRRGLRYHERAAAAAVRFGIGWVLHHEHARMALCLYWLGRWEDAVEDAEVYLAETGAGHHNYGEPMARCVRSRIAYAEGRVDAAREDAEAAQRIAREVADPQVLFPTLAWAARLNADSRAGEEAAGEVLRLWQDQGGHSFAAYSLVDLACALDTFGRGSDFVREAETMPSLSRWQRAAVAWAEHDFDEAATLLEEIGSLHDAALARARAADAVADQPRR